MGRIDLIPANGTPHENHTTSIQSPLATQNQTTSYGYNARGEQNLFEERRLHWKPSSISSKVSANLSFLPAFDTLFS
jgi:hypothetical protein